MDTSNPNPAFADYPPELIRRVAEQASRDAELVVHILDCVGLAPPPAEIRRLPAELLLELGAAARLLCWEQNDLTLHREAGLPSASDAISRTFQDAAERKQNPAAPPADLSLSLAVFNIALDRLAWSGPTYLQAEILLDTPDEDALIEALAQLLWSRRNLVSACERGATP